MPQDGCSGHPGLRDPRGGARAVAGLLLVEGADGGGEFGGVGGGQVEDDGLAGLGGGVVAAELGEDGVDLGEVVGAGGDDEAGVPDVGDEDGVGAVGGVVGGTDLVELLDEGLEAGEFLRGTELDEAGLAGGGGALGGLEWALLGLVALRRRRRA